MNMSRVAQKQHTHLDLMNDIAAELRGRWREGKRDSTKCLRWMEGSIANDDDLLGSYPPLPSRMLDWHGPHCPPDTSVVCNGWVARAE